MNKELSNRVSRLEKRKELTQGADLELLEKINAGRQRVGLPPLDENKLRGGDSQSLVDALLAGRQRVAEAKEEKPT